MTLAAGTRLGPYEIIAPLGAGAMGEVYRARDNRLARDVAVKIVSAGLAVDSDAARRFEAEARAAGQLNNPHVLAIYDVGTHEGRPFIVSELLEGQTLRERLEKGQLTIRQVIDYMIQIAQGLGAAHDKGIVHRDLKPENLFITRDDCLKILDFGLAKLTNPSLLAAEASLAQTVFDKTEAGLVLGTVGYMSPEQIRGQPVDSHADVFSVGAILYEMFTGERAFRRESAIETMSAILKEEPVDLVQGAHRFPAGLDRIVRRCLEKRPDARWHSVHDLAFALEAVASATTSGSVTQDTTTTTAAATPPAARRAVVAAAAVGLALAAALIGVAVARQRAGLSSPTFQRLTFGRGTIWSARFAPEGRTIVYSATWDGRPVELFSTRADGQESRSLAIPGADVSAISSSGDMALLLKPGTFVDWAWKWGTVARASLAGGAPREMLKRVERVDWGADGTSLAVVRAAGAGSQIEFPIGHVLYETPNRIGALRVSRRGDRIAFAAAGSSHTTTPEAFGFFGALPSAPVSTMAPETVCAADGAATRSARQQHATWNAACAQPPWARTGMARITPGLGVRMEKL